MSNGMEINKSFGLFGFAFPRRLLINLLMPLSEELEEDDDQGDRGHHY